MGKKKRQNQNSNSHADSSESESSKDSTQPAEETKTCSHINKSVEIANIRKTLVKVRKDGNMLTLCGLCKSKQTKETTLDGWVCLRCGSCNCGPEMENHRVEHYKTPRSDSHFLAFHINTNIIWCFGCEKEIPVDVNRKVQSCADFIKKQCSEHSPFNSVKMETDTTKMNGNDSGHFFKQETASCQSQQNDSEEKNGFKPSLNLNKVKGLMNLGNTCFFNSVLQCLAQTPGLIDLLREMDVPGEKFNIELDGVTIDAVLEKHKTSALSDQLAQVLTEVAGKGDIHYGVNPRRLLNALTSKCPQFEGGDQHDAHELLRHLLDSVHTEDLRRYQKAILNHIGYNKSLDEVDEDKKKFGKKLNQKVCETIPIRPDQVFKGSLVSILECMVCGHFSKRDEPFLDLSLPVAQEKAQPPIVRRKQNCNSPVEEEKNTEVTISKHQQKKEKKNARRNRKQQRKKKEQGQGEPTIEEEDKKDSIDGEQSDADVEDNEDNACDEQDHKAEVVESGYSSEKQMSARGSPVTTQSPEEESKFNFQPEVTEYTVFKGCQLSMDQDKPLSDMSVCSADPETALSKRAESGVGSIKELTVTIPEETNIESTSQDSVRVNASNGSPDISSDSQNRHLKTIDLSSADECKLPPSNESQIDRTAMIYNWNCTGDGKSQSQDSSSVSLSVSPQCGSQSNNATPKGSPLSGVNSNDNMSVCNSLPENVSLILNSPIKCQNSLREENSGSEERPKSRMEFQKNRSSPVELVETTELDSGLLKLSLEEVTFSRKMENCDGIEERTSMVMVEYPSKLQSSIASTIMPCENNSMLDVVEDVTAQKSPIPLPPPLPLFTASYSFSHTEPPAQRYNTNYPKYKTEEGECSLQSCLNQFTTVEMLAGGNKVGCEACTERANKGNKEGKTVYQNSTKQLLISKLPPVVIFHLKRFQVQRCSFRKISRHVDFPLVFDISPYCSLKKSEPILYSLYGVVEHSGTLHGGHYVAYVKVRSHKDSSPGCPPPGKWYYVSDSRVSDVDESSVLKTQAYLLFYERIL